MSQSLFAFQLTLSSFTARRFSQMLLEGLPSLETFYLSTPDVGHQRDGYSREQQTNAERQTQDK